MSSLRHFQEVSRNTPIGAITISQTTTQAATIVDAKTAGGIAKVYPAEAVFG